MAKSNYDSRLCCSRLNRKLVNTICRDKLVENKPDLVPIKDKLTENDIITSMIKIYTGYISLEEFEEKANDDKHRRHKQ